MKGLIKVVESKELFQEGELSHLDKFEDEMFRDKTIMRFENFESAVEFGKGFFSGYLIPTYGKENASKFPMARSEPAETLSKPEDGARKLAEALELSQRDPTKEVWLVIPTNRYHEVQEYIDSINN